MWTVVISIICMFFIFYTLTIYNNCIAIVTGTLTNSYSKKTTILSNYTLINYIHNYRLYLCPNPSSMPCRMTYNYVNTNNYYVLILWCLINMMIHIWVWISIRDFLSLQHGHKFNVWNQQPHLCTLPYHNGINSQCSDLYILLSIWYANKRPIQ